MNKMTLERLAENYALNQYLSDYSSNYDEIMEAFYNDKCPEDVIIWNVFDRCNYSQLMEYIENTRNDFLEFAERVKNENL